MNVRVYAGLVAICPLLAGCRQDQNTAAYLDKLHAEYRTLEDDYFELKDHYLIAKSELEELRQQPAQTPGVPSEEDESGGPEIEFGGPQIDLGTPVDPMDLDKPDGAKRQIHDPQVMQTVALSPDLTVIRPAGHTRLPPEPLDMQVTHIVINPYLTSGHDFDRKPGDDGVSLVIEPRNADDQFVPQAGAVRIAVIDPAAEGDAAYVAEWSFDAEQTRRRLKRGMHQRGIHFKLPWPDKPPQHAQLRVFVRYQNEQGEQAEQGELSDDEELYVALPGEFSHRWTPKSPAAEMPVVLDDAAEFLQRSTTGNPTSRASQLADAAQQESTGQLELHDRARKPLSRPEWKPFRSRNTYGQLS